MGLDKLIHAINEIIKGTPASDFSEAVKDAKEGKYDRRYEIKHGFLGDTVIDTKTGKEYKQGLFGGLSETGKVYERGLFGGWYEKKK